MGKKFKTTLTIEVVVDPTVYPTHDGVPITQQQIEDFFSEQGEAIGAFAPEGTDCKYTVNTVPVEEPLN